MRRLITHLTPDRWHPASISGSHFATQFREEYEAAIADAGRFSPQGLLHFFVRWGIVGCYHLLTYGRTLTDPGR